MRPLALLRQRLGWKLFLSYLIIILVGVLVLAVTAQFHMTSALTRHIAEMQAALGDDPALARDLEASFHTAINEVLTIAALAAFLAAVAVSLFVSRRIVQPIQEMMRVSQDIAAGDYRQRVRVPSDDELGVLAEAFNQAAAQLEKTEQRRMELIGNVAHELRTPLTGIRSIIEGLTDGVLPAESETFLGVQHEVSRLQRLVRDLEELSKAEAGQIPLDIRPTAPEELVRAAVDRLAGQFQDKDVTLQVDLAPRLPALAVDAGRIIQVLTNLLGNALQYTPPGGQVLLRAARQAGQVVITVQDTGMGIAAEHLPHIFERFYRVDKSRARVGGGSGIGLTIAKHLVEAHGGRISAASPGLGQGSAFTVMLPVPPGAV